MALYHRDEGIRFRRWVGACSSLNASKCSLVLGQCKYVFNDRCYFEGSSVRTSARIKRNENSPVTRLLNGERKIVRRVRNRPKCPRSRWFPAPPTYSLLLSEQGSVFFSRCAPKGSPKHPLPSPFSLSFSLLLHATPTTRSYFTTRAQLDVGRGIAAKRVIFARNYELNV